MASDLVATPDPLARLTSAQRDAVTSPDPRLAVFAGAGAGKTRVLTLRVARMVDEGVDPSHILVVTFSRKAAQELRSRLWRLDIEGVRAGTFHRTALELLEVYRAEQGLGPPTIVADRRRMIERVMARSPSSQLTSQGAAVETEISWAKARGLTPSTYESAASQERRRPQPSALVVAEQWAAYEEAKRRQGVLDFDDLIADAVAALGDTRFATAMHWRTRHLFVDEFQDVNPMQFMLIERLMTPSTTLFGVGDPNQSIYGFNGADPTLLRRLDQRIEGTRTILLDANHRSTPEIVASASAVLPARDQRPITATQAPGEIPEIAGFDDDAAEAAFVANRARSIHGPHSKWRSFAVLARTNAQLSAITEAFAAQGIPVAPLAPDLRPASDLMAPLPQQRRAPNTAPTSDAVALGTFHRAKGLEFPHVFVIGVSDGLVPHGAATSDAALDEERRLLYVALTRAEQTLHVTWSAHRGNDQAGRTRRRSPFLDPFERVLDEMRAHRRPTPSATGAARVAALKLQLEAQAAARQPSEGSEDHHG